MAKQAGYKVSEYWGDKYPTVTVPGIWGWAVWGESIPEAFSMKVKPLKLCSLFSIFLFVIRRTKKDIYRNLEKTC